MSNLSQNELLNTCTPIQNEKQTQEELKDSKSYYFKYIKMKRRRNFFCISLVFLCVTIITALITIDLKTTSNKELFNRYYREYCSHRDNYDEIESYIKGDYEEVINNVEKDSLFINARLLVINSMVKKKEFNTAIEYINKPRNVDEEFLKALCYLRLKNDFEAEELFSIIYKEKGIYSIWAKKILDDNYRNYYPHKNKY